VIANVPDLARVVVNQAVLAEEGLMGLRRGGIRRADPFPIFR
jgi:hypothetical protein